MKKTTLVVVSVLVLLAGAATAGTKEFWKGGIYVTPQFGINSWGGSIPFGVNVEYGLTENIGIGGSAMFNFWSDEWWSETLINLAAEAAYHFTKIPTDKLDLYAGAGLGYSIYSWKYKSGYSGWDDSGSGSSGLYLQLIAGVRYFVSPKIAVSLRAIGSLIGHWAGVGGALGATFILGK
ncbi:MAG: outer membrane beta-barrel protein [Candidatus Aminicenantes bacterium]|nr:outer membrane beta-barrel protein [Candidatus Aminicenantes bacterium]